MNHNNVSYIKSVLRIIAGVFLITSNLVLAGVFLIIAELLGILEELV